MTKDELLERLQGRVNEALTYLRGEVDERERGDAALKELLLEGNTYNGGGAQDAQYDSKLFNSYYICRYAKAYAYEYATMYDIVMRSYVKNGGHDQLGAFSFGCGSMIDAWSMLYAKVTLGEEDNCYQNCKLYYKGVDAQNWMGTEEEPGIKPFVYPINYPTEVCDSLRDEFGNIRFLKTI